MRAAGRGLRLLAPASARLAPARPAARRMTGHAHRGAAAAAAADDGGGGRWAAVWAGLAVCSGLGAAAAVLGAAPVAGEARCDAFGAAESNYDLKQHAQNLPPPPATNPGAFGPNFIADACEVAIPALVNICSVQKGPWGQIAQSAGSGFIIRSDGLIATNAHVVRGAKVLNITLNDGRQYRGRVLSADELSDLALVLVEDPLEAPLPVMAIGDSGNLRPGEFVIALGSPLNMQNSVTAGIVSSTARAASEIGIPQSRLDYIQTDAAINVGNSGGPLINLKGEVVGINTMKVAGGDGIGFAIPINAAWLVLQQLRDTGKVVRPFLGLRMASLNKNLVRHEKRQNNNFPDVETGLLVVGVAPDSPAMRAGIRPGDVIVEFEGKGIATVQELTRAIGYDVGKTYSITVARRGTGTEHLSITSEGLKL